jgi:hypothetical protein
VNIILRGISSFANTSLVSQISTIPGVRAGATVHGLYIQISFGDGLDPLVLIYTGSYTSCVFASYADNALPDAPRRSRPPVVNVTSGGSNTITQVLDASFVLEGFVDDETQICTINQTLQVFPDVRDPGLPPIILGLDFLAAHGCDILLTESCIVIKELGGLRIPLDIDWRE